MKIKIKGITYSGITIKRFILAAQSMSYITKFFAWCPRRIIATTTNVALTTEGEYLLQYVYLVQNNYSIGTNQYNKNNCKVAI
jgi:hypothetical protein